MSIILVGVVPDGVTEVEGEAADHSKKISSVGEKTDRIEIRIKKQNVEKEQRGKSL